MKTKFILSAIAVLSIGGFQLVGAQNVGQGTRKVLRASATGRQKARTSLVRKPNRAQAISQRKALNLAGTLNMDIR